MSIVVAIVCGLAGGIVWSSIFEWTLHKYVMHKPFFGFRYPFQAHALTHHRIFDWDDTYWLHDANDLDNVTFAWWNAPVLIGLNTPLMAGAVWLVTGGFTPEFWVASGCASGAMTLYYAAYESLHYCMHVPDKRWFQKMGWFRWIDDHHRMHHKRPTSNLNVVLPLADYLFRTKMPGLAPVSRMAEEAREGKPGRGTRSPVSSGRS
jgi:hypothetical protein